MSITESLQKLARSLNLCALGAAPVERYREAPPGHRPDDFLPGARSVVTFACRLSDGPLNNLPHARNQYMVEFEAVNRILLDAAYRIARFLENQGFESMPFGPEAAIGDYARLKGDFSHKHSAVLCGLGSFGINNLLLTPEHGPRVRLASVVTTAELDYNEPLSGELCRRCLKCVQVCPSGALEQWEGRYSSQTGWIINKEKCAHYMFVVNAGKRCGICVSACKLPAKKCGGN
ncbi:epoxyqueuosine reductase QueG [Desulfofundulus luciae]|uniref:Epoxyqueuosine reductase QueG n=1 Tax=Desulfofundulus luciae TaxID=74702 RepID=A0ABU0B4Q6_9FIRM|nr:4Fe-4S dicluster domain-containing protein [Desulfofundulus luciae]MDQ0287696.1 epoxyqueuosine reductase QueG [Desulfofundulus luciae]